MQELAPTRGFQSSVDYVLTFGLGARDTVDSLKVVWPDGRVSTLQARRRERISVVTVAAAAARRPRRLPAARPARRASAARPT